MANLDHENYYSKIILEINVALANENAGIERLQT
jgi:hypothetical protein